MTFTKTPPTTPGFYAWRSTTEDACVMAITINVHHVGMEFSTGEWCRLVPAEEVDKAHYEGWLDREFRTGVKDKHSTWYAASRAKRVAEGKE